MVKLMKIPGRKKPIRLLTWVEARQIVERTIKENKKFYKELESL